MKSLEMQIFWTIWLVCLFCDLSEAEIDYLYIGDYVIKNEMCFFVPSYGVCFGRLRVFGYDYKANRCIMFLYSGCGGNANRFPTENDCRRHCRYDEERDIGVTPDDYDYSSSSTTDYYEAQPTMETEEYDDDLK